MSTLPAISIHQPWASFIAHGIKRTEGRTHGRFAGLVGQRVAIHATKMWDKDWREKVPEELLEGVVIPWLSKQANLTPEQWARFDYGDFMPRTFPQGAVIATGEMVEMIHVLDLADGMGLEALHAHESRRIEQERMNLTYLWAGDWLYRFEDVRLLDPPVKVAGRQGIWREEIPNQG